MSQPRLKWGEVERYFLRRGYTIRTGGTGEKQVVAPRGPDPKRTRPVVRIGHKWCARPGNELLPAYVKAIERAFGVTAEEIRGG